MTSASEQKQNDGWHKESITPETITTETIKKIETLYLDTLGHFNGNLIFKIDEFVGIFNSIFDHQFGNYVKKRVIECLGYTNCVAAKFGKHRSNDIIYINILNNSEQAQTIQKSGIHEEITTTDLLPPDTSSGSSMNAKATEMAQLLDPNNIRRLNREYHTIEKIKKMIINSKGESEHEYVTPQNKRNILNEVKPTSQPSQPSSIDDITSDEQRQMNRELNIIQTFDNSELEEAKASVEMAQINESLSSSLQQNASDSYLIEYNKVSALFESFGKLWVEYYSTKGINAEYISGDKTKRIINDEHTAFRDFIIGRQKYLAPTLNLPFAIPTQHIHAAFHKTSTASHHWKQTAISCVAVIMTEYVKHFKERKNWCVFETGKMIKTCNDLAKALQEINFQQTGWNEQ